MPDADRPSGGGTPGRRLDIAFLSSWWRDPLRGSGTAVGIDGLARALAARGHRIHHVAPRRLRRPLLLGRLLFNVGLARRLARRGFDLVVGFDCDGFLLPAAQRDRLVVALKGVAADERRFEAGPSRMALGILARWEGRNARRARRVLVTSEYCRGVVARAYGIPARRTAVVPEGIDLGAWPVSSSRPRGATPGRILTVGRQYPRKDTATLLAALPGVRAARPEVRLHVVGGGPELARLRRQRRRLGLEGAVELLGEVPRERLAAEYASAELFCLPSRQEGFGIVLLEAMASRLAIVAAAAGAVPEVAPDGEAARLVPAGDARSLGRALRDLLADREAREELGEGGRRRVAAYDWPAVALRFLAAVAPVVAQQGGLEDGVLA